jgi:hypothetical protein
MLDSKIALDDFIAQNQGTALSRPADAIAAAFIDTLSYLCRLVSPSCLVLDNKASPALRHPTNTIDRDASPICKNTLRDLCHYLKMALYVKIGL